MDQEEYILGIADYLAILKRRKNLLLFPALIIFAIAVLIAFALPSIYRSEGTVLIEQQEIPPDLVRSTVTSYAGERIQIISQRVMTNEIIARIIEQYGLYKDELQKESLATMVTEMRENISLEMISADVVDPRSGRSTTATIAFKLAFNYKSPLIVQKVTSELISLYLNENLRQRTRSAVETSSFLEVEANRLKQEVSKLEEAMASFKERNINNLPELQQLNIQLMERAERDLKDIDQNIRNLEERKIYLSSELAQMSPTSNSYLNNGKRLLSAEDQLQLLQTEFIGLSSRYANTHPDLIKMSKEITALKKETGYGGDVKQLQGKYIDLNIELATLKERYSAQHPDVKKMQRAVASAKTELQKAKKADQSKKIFAANIEADNPAFIQLQAQLNVATIELSAFIKSRVEAKEKIEEFELRLLSSPQVEREYKDITRDYENATLKYREVNNKQLEAELASSLERESKGERFSLIEPPQVPEKPAKPNRSAIIFLGFVLAVGFGFGLVAVTESMNTAIRSPQELIRITSSVPLIVVPYINTMAEIAKQKALIRKVVLAIMLGGVIFVAIFHFVILPMDVLYFVVIRKLGLSE